MFALSPIVMPDGSKTKMLFDVKTTLPLLYPLRYSIDHLNNRSSSSQDASLQAIKYFYEYWLLKHGKTFCYSFFESDHNPSIAINELDNFFQYLVDGYSYTPKIIKFNPTPSRSIYTHAERVRAVARFIKYLIGKYITAQYYDDEPKEIIRYSDRVLKTLKVKTEGYSSLLVRRKVDEPNVSQGYKSLTIEMVAAIYEIITPSSNKKRNELNPFSTIPLQWRNYLIVRILLNYGLRVGELMLLELESIKTNIRGNKYSLIIANISDDNHDSRARLPSLKTDNAHRVIDIEQHDYEFLQFYINRIRPKSKHRFVFTALKAPFSPLSYPAIYLLFNKLDDAFTKNHPTFKNPKYSDSINKITPHVARHTWAYLTLERIYEKKYKEVLKLTSRSGIDFSNNGIMEDSKSELRELAGWSYGSHMPTHYAKRFMRERANESNLERIKAETATYTENIGNF